MKKTAFASILALVFLSLFAALAVSFMVMNDTNLAQADNLNDVQTVLYEAESGLTFCNYLLSNVSLSQGLSSQEKLDALATALQSALNGTANLGSSSVTYDGSTIIIPGITIDDTGRSFSANLTMNVDDQIRLIVTGQDGSINRSLSLNYDITEDSDFFDNYGVATGGPVMLDSNANIRGANNFWEADVLSTASSQNEAFYLEGNSVIEGDLFATNPDAHATLIGNVMVGGEAEDSDAIQDHIHFGVEEGEFPEVDPTVFEPFATNVITSGTNTSDDQTFTNIRIAANSNPDFSGNITIKGVIYIESPNEVQFTGNIDIQGVIVTEDAGDNNYDSNRIRLSGNTTVQGVDSLPDTPEFSALKALPGSCLLAPGFSVELDGNLGAVNGTMAAEEFKWNGNAAGTIHGQVISYGDTVFEMIGNAEIIIDKSSYSGIPSGFNIPVKLQANVSTYTEY